MAGRMVFAGSVLAAALVGAGTALVAQNVATPAADPPARTEVAQVPALPPNPALAERRVPATRADAQASYAPVVARAAPAVVNVYAKTIRREVFRSPFADDPVFRRFFGDQFGVPRERVENSLGSGVIVRPDGVIVTNNHVVAGATELRVVLADRREFPARVIVTDPRSDLAVLQIDTGGERLAALTFADTRDALVGDQVLAIGNPFGVGQTVTGGIISALARTDIGITDFSFFIQTDAAINPGNSGGALVDMNGALVGVNTAIFSRDGGSAGVGFAVPAEMVKRVVESALADGRIVRPWTGARAQTVDAEIARTMSLSRPGGAVLTELYPGGPAERAGLRRGDVIVALGGADVADEQGLRYLAATRRPGERVPVVYMRGGQRGEAQITLQPPPSTPAREERVIAARSSFQGAKVATLNPATADEAGLDAFTRGVLILDVAADSPAAREGLRPGDLILELGGEPVATASGLEGRLRGDGRRGQVILQRGDRRLTATLFL